MTFVPHVLLAALLYAWLRGVPHADTAAFVVAAALPWWVLHRERAHSLRRAFLRGPVLVLAVALAVWLAWDADEPDWLLKLVLGAALAAYALYNIVVFALAAWLRSRRRSQHRGP